MSDTYGTFDEEARKLEKEHLDWLPRKEDKLFRESGSSALLDPLGFSLPHAVRSLCGRWILYADGFLLAADRLVDSYGNQPWEDALIYSVLTLYRHHIELSLKILVNSCPAYLSGLSEEEASTRIRKLSETHDLKKLWHTLKTLYPRCNDWASQEQIEAFETLLFEFDEHDPDSQASRYPVHRKGSQTLLNLRAIDLCALKEGVTKISHYLDCIYEGLGQEADWRAEMESW